MRKTQGQTLVEFLIFIWPVFFMLTGALRLMLTEWNQTQCAYLVFESTHSKRTGKALPRTSFTVQLSESEDRWKGVGICGDARESVELPKLESARW